MKKFLVLPFHIHKSIKDKEYLIDGILEELIDLISASNQVKTTSRSISLYLNAHPKLGRELSKEFGIDFVIEGNVKSTKAGIVLTMRLVDTSKEDILHMVSTPFNHENWTGQIKALLWELLDTKINRAEETEQTLIQNKVKELYLKGIYHWNRYTYHELLLAIGFFKKAIQIDETYAQAYAGLADCYSIIAIMGYDTPAYNYQLAKKAVNNALHYNNKHSDSYVCAAMIDIFCDTDYPKAKSNLEYALKLNPNNVKANHFFTFYALFTSQLDLAEKHALIALKEDALSTPHYASLIRISIYRKNFSKALDYVEAGAIIDPDSVPLKEMRAQVYLHLGNLEKAIEEYETCIELSDENPLSFAFLGYTYAVAGFYDDSRIIEAKMTNISTPKKTGMYSFSKGIIRLGQRDYDGFFRQLNLAIKEGLTVFIGELLYNPIYSEIKKDKRFKGILREIGADPDVLRLQKKAKPASALTIKSHTQFQLTLDPQDIAYIEAEGNYSTIHWYSQGILKHQILRITLKQLEIQLKAFQMIIRCHKSYMIHINEDLSLTGNAKGYFFESTFFPIRIPISRSKNELVKKIFSD